MQNIGQLQVHILLPVNAILADSYIKITWKMQIFKVEGMRQRLLYLSRIILSFDNKKMWQLGTFGIPESNSNQTTCERRYRAEISSD